MRRCILRITLILAIEIVIGLVTLFASFDNIPYFIILACLSFIIIISMLRPSVGLLFIVLFVISDNLYYKINFTPHIVDIHAKIIALLPVVVFGGWFLQQAVKKNAFPAMNSLIILSFLLLIWAGASIFWGGYPPYGYFQWWMLFSGFLIYFLMIALVLNKSYLKKIMIFMMFVGLLASILCILSKITGQKVDLVSKEGDWPIYLALYTNVGDPRHFARGGGMAGPNMAASFINVCILLTMALYLMEKRKSKRIFFLLSIIFLIAGNAFTSSRAGFFSLFLGFVAFGLMEPSLRGRFIRYFLIISTVMTIFFFFSRIGSPQWGAKQLEEITQFAGEGGGPTGSVLSRAKLWRAGMALFLQDPILGTGLGGIRVYTPYPNAHSVYFSILFELGLVGMLLFLIFIGGLLKNLLSAFKVCQDSHLQIILRAFLSILIIRALEFTVHFEINQPHIWLIFGIGVAIINIVSNEAKTFLQMATDSG